MFFAFKDVSQEERTMFEKSKDQAVKAQCDDDDGKEDADGKKKGTSWYSHFDDLHHVLAAAALVFGNFVTATGVGALEIRIARMAESRWGW